jgi:ketosteroid isomerase-like protein
MTADHLAVARANQLFYAAVQEANIEKMSASWLHESWVKCTHPGWEVLCGWNDVKASWEQIFTHGQQLSVVISDVEVKLADHFASLSCTENLTVVDEETQIPTSVSLSASNLFKRVGDQWLMIHHHSTPILKPS